ncbi:hypothetical protein GCM10023325_04460 [Sphingomonas lutea]
MRLFNALATASFIAWAIMLWSTGQHTRWLGDNSREALHPARMMFYVGVPALMLLLTLGSAAATRFVGRRAADYRGDHSHRLAPIPVFCLLLLLPYLMVLFIVG